MPKQPPIVCDLILLERCNMRCKMCRVWDRKSPGELTFAECKTLLSDFKSLAGSSSLEVNLSGGEPLLREDIIDLIGLCSKNGFSSSMATNGYLLGPEMVKRLAGSGLNKIILSVASLNEETHDFFRGVKGSYAKLREAIDLIVKYWPGAKLYINTIIKDKNLGDIIDLVNWVQGTGFIGGIGFQALAQPFYTPKDDYWYEKKEYSDLWPQDSSRLSAVIDRLIEFKAQDYKIGNSVEQLKLFKDYYSNPRALIRKTRCNFGEYIVNITPLGEVILCPAMPIVGNIKEAGIASIWHSEKAMSARARMNACDVNCNNIINCWFRSRTEF